MQRAAPYAAVDDAASRRSDVWFRLPMFALLRRAAAARFLDAHADAAIFIYLALMPPLWCHTLVTMILFRFFRFHWGVIFSLYFFASMITSFVLPTLRHDIFAAYFHDACYESCRRWCRHAFTRARWCRRLSRWRIRYRFDAYWWSLICSFLPCRFFASIFMPIFLFAIIVAAFATFHYFACSLTIAFSSPSFSYFFFRCQAFFCRLVFICLPFFILLRFSFLSHVLLPLPDADTLRLLIFCHFLRLVIR